MKNAYDQYKKSSIQSASREKILLMMYEGAIKFLKRAIDAAEKNDIAARGLNITRTYDIVMELNNTLDHNIGGEISTNLEQLYMFIVDQMTKANVTGEIDPLVKSLNILETLYQSWQTAISSLKENPPTNGAPNNG